MKPLLAKFVRQLSNQKCGVCQYMALKSLTLSEEQFRLVQMAAMNDLTTFFTLHISVGVLLADHATLDGSKIRMRTAASRFLFRFVRPMPKSLTSYGDLLKSAIVRAC